MFQRLTLALALLFAFAATAAAEPQPRLSGVYIGPVVGHMQTTETVRFPGGQQINDVSGNSPLVGLRMGWARANPGGLFYGVGGVVLQPIESYASTIVRAFGAEYVVEYGARGSIYGRLGYAVRDDAAIYAIVGYNIGRARVTVDGQQRTQTFGAPEVGFGTEIAVGGPRTSFRADFTATRYRDRDAFLVDTTGVHWTVLVSWQWRF